MLRFIFGRGPLDMSHEWKRLVRENTTAELPTQSSTSLSTSPHRRLYGLVPVALPHHSLLVSCDYFNCKHLAVGSKMAESRIRRRHAVCSGLALTSPCCLSQCKPSVQSDEDRPLRRGLITLFSPVWSPGRSSARTTWCAQGSMYERRRSPRPGEYGSSPTMFVLGWENVTSSQITRFYIVLLSGHFCLFLFV